MTNTPDLLPCPFCGCTTVNRVEEDAETIWHHCDWCETVGPHEAPDADPPQGWNHRAPQAVAVEVKPVAWAESYDEGQFFNTVSLRPTKHHTIPLYTHPTPAPVQDEAVKRLVDAVHTERQHKSAYDATATDRGGHKGPKGVAYQLWMDARADVGRTLAAMEGR